MDDFCSRHHLRLATAIRLLGLISVLSATTHVEAADKRWNNRFGGAFNAAANWSGGIPGSGDIAEFGVATLFTPGTYTITFDVSPTNQAIHVEDDSVTFDLNGHTYTTTEFLGNEIGNIPGSTGRLTITDGTWHVAAPSNDQVYIGAVAGATGFLTVSTGGRLTGSSHVRVGMLGTGSLTVQNGGSVQADFVSIGQEGVGIVDVTGAGSTLNTNDVLVAHMGTGTLTITAGGVVQSTFVGPIGNLGESTGTVHVDGAASRWITTDDLIVGNGGDGTLMITAGARVQNANAVVAQNVGSTGIATIAGSGIWTNSGDLTIGSEGNATMNITAGGRVDDINGYIGFGPGSKGTVSVGEQVPGFAASQWINSGTLTVGNFGNATLNIIPNGRVQNSNAIIAADAGSLAEVNVSTGAAQWLNLGNLTVAQAGEGTLNITGGGYVQNVDGTVGAVAGSTGRVNVTEAESQWRSTGTVTVGLGGHGTLSISGGGIVQVDETMFIAQDLNSVGVVTVDGAGSDLNSSSGMQIGNSGQATVTVTNGGSLSSSFAEIGGLDGLVSSVTIQGPGSTWNTGAIDVGDGGDASLLIADGGQVESGFGLLADDPDSDALVTVTGPGSSWTIESGNFLVGDDGAGTLNILAGATVANLECRIAADVGSSGVVFVSGAGSAWTNNGPLVVGAEGTGELTIQAGATVTSADLGAGVGGTLGSAVGSSGTALVTGSGSAWSTGSDDLIVGDNGTGDLTIDNGGSVSNRDGSLGQQAGGSGDVTVTGAGSTWANSSGLSVGNFGDGTLTIADGGSVTDNFGFIATFEGSSGDATVTGTDSTWTNAAFFAVGQGGDGTLAIEAGGVVTSPRGFIGARSPGTGDVVITGAGSAWNSTEVFVVGFQGDAELTISGGGSAISNDAWIAGAATSTASVTLFGAGSNWSIAGRLAISDAFDPVELGPGGGTGTLNIQPGAKVTVGGDTALFPGATLMLEGGTLDTASVSFNGGGTFAFLSGKLHVGMFNGDLLNQGGTLAPGHSSGTTTINGSYAQLAGATLEIEIGGATPGAFDVVNVSGLAAISGELNVALLDGFVPGASDTFTVLTSAIGIFGSFSNVVNGQRLTTLDSLGSFLVHYGPGSAFDPNQIVLSGFEPAELPGDFNFDGTVDAADYVTWRKGLGTTHTDGGFNVWRAHFAETAGLGAAESSNIPAVPEPAPLATAMLAAVALNVACRRSMVAALISL